MLTERPHIVYWLRSIKIYRSQGSDIIYMDETWVDNNLTFGKCWQSDDILGVVTNTSSSNRIIVVQAGSKNGFIDGSELLFKAGKVSGDYHGQMNGQNF